MKMLPWQSPFVGRPLAFTPEQLAEKFGEFIEWCEDASITIVDQESGTTPDGNTFGKEKVYVHPRMVSVRGFLVFIGKTQRWWGELSNGKHGKKFSAVKERICEYCEHYQLEMASTGVFKENIIARLLGLADKHEDVGENKNVTIVVKSEEEKKKLNSMTDLGV